MGECVCMYVYMYVFVQIITLYTFRLERAYLTFNLSIQSLINMNV